MSHIVTIQAEVRDPLAVVAACRRLGLPEPLQGTARLFSGEATGLLVKLPGWLYPAVVDIETGRVQVDNYEGRWGDPRHLGLFMQAYAVEKARLEASKEGLCRQRAAPGRRQHPPPDRRVRLTQLLRPGSPACGPPLRALPIPQLHISEKTPMPRIIEVTVSARGETTVQTRGYAGGDCLAAGKFLELALGRSTADVKTAEFYQGQAAEKPLRQSQ